MGWVINATPLMLYLREWPGNENVYLHLMTMKTFPVLVFVAVVGTT
jgi:hypothetical protein